MLPADIRFALVATLAMFALPAAALAETRAFKLASATVTRSICPYCSVSCGIIMYGKTEADKLFRQIDGFATAFELRAAGVTLVEVLLVLAVSTIVIGPLTAWAVLAMRRTQVEKP